jgi:hypothetical protein
MCGIGGMGVRGHAGHVGGPGPGELRGGASG